MLSKGSDEKKFEDRYRELLDLQILKDNLVNMIAHDLRNPLSGAIGYLSLMESTDCSDVGERSACMEYVKDSLHLVRKVSGLISDMLDLSRLENNSLPLRPEDTAINDLVEESLMDFEMQIKQKNLKIQMDAAESMEIKADRKLLGRVIGNILSNSIRYSPEGGTVTVITGRNELGCQVTIGNEGPFIPESILENIFEKFFQAEARAADIRSGAGLGLAFCRLVVEAHGGTIRADNNADKGCRFTISLPA